MKKFATNEEIFSWIKDLTQWGHRKTGTPEGRKSAEYIKDKFESFGLEDVTIEKVKCEINEPQKWELKIENEVIPSYYINGTFVSNKPGRNTLGENGIDKELIYLGEGWQEDFENIDIRGKIVVCDIRFQNRDDRTRLEQKKSRGNEPYVYDPEGTMDIPRRRSDIFSPNNWPYNYFRAQVGGAAGFIGILADYFDSCEYYNENYLEFSGEFGIDSMNIPGLWVSRSTGKQIKSMIHEGALTANIIMDTISSEKEARNVSGILPGVSNEIILVHSHHDAVYEGAVQDGSGTSEVIALAQYFSQFGKEERQKTLMFAATDTHYESYVGHEAFIEQRKKNNQDIILDVSIEHIGKEVELDENNNAALTGYTDLRNLYVSGSEILMEITINEVEKNQLTRSMINYVPAVKTRVRPDDHEFSPDEIISDAYPFHQAGTGVISVVSPQMYIFHPSDKPDMVAVDDLQKVGLTFAGIINKAMQLSKKQMGVIGLIDS
ncbi:M28 family peptidase [Hominibacterium faecale]|uniref:M28 family peptidase n=1 Tax=Hominibacterium faecale TaxID=2839743 RepID=UPI0022B2A9A7|nr:M28 family peptidase [Hominibacterium faecale]